MTASIGIATYDLAIYTRCDAKNYPSNDAALHTVVMTNVQYGLKIRSTRLA